MSKNTSEIFRFANFKYYQGPNPYLNTAAVVFDLSLTQAHPLAVEDYQDEMSRKLPQLQQLQFTCHRDLIVKAIAELNNLEMELDLGRFIIQSYDNYDRIAVQTLDRQTSYGVVDLVGDWLEAITQRKDFSFKSRLSLLQERFRRSFYGGPTSYSLWYAAKQKAIPTFYLPDEKLIQYGYGKYQVRGIGTTFDCDSHLDSDFATQKDYSKDFLAKCGFPVPPGKVVYSLREALEVAADIGYPVAVKPVAGHKGIGVTANIPDAHRLELAFEQAADASSYHNIEVIVEKHIPGNDFRLLCVGGKFVAGLERRPPFVIGDGKTTISKLIKQENATEARLDTPTSPLAKIIVDEAMEDYLDEQRLSIHSIPSVDQVVYLRKVANISSGGVSVNITDQVHPDNQILAEEIAQYLRLVCLGVDLISPDISQSWQEGNCGIIEINSAPGVFMHLKPAIGDSIDVPSQIIKFLFAEKQACRIPIITFNRLEGGKLQELIEHILENNASLRIGGACQQGIWLNHRERKVQPNYNSNLSSLLRHPQLDCLIAEYTEAMFEQEGIAYEGSNLIILDKPTEKEKILTRDLLSSGKLIIKEENNISVGTLDNLQVYPLSESESFSDVYTKEIIQLLTVKLS